MAEIAELRVSQASGNLASGGAAEKPVRGLRLAQHARVRSTSALHLRGVLACGALPPSRERSSPLSSAREVFQAHHLGISDRLQQSISSK